MELSNAEGVVELLAIKGGSNIEFWEEGKPNNSSLHLTKV